MNKSFKVNRLEHHSSNMIPATYWYRLHSRKLEEDIKMDTEKRAMEYKRVKNNLMFKTVSLSLLGKHQS